MEAARLHPAAPRAVRVCNASTRVCGVHFPKGCTVILPIHIIHRNPAHWPEPEKFDPERLALQCVTGVGTSRGGGGGGGGTGVMILEGSNIIGHILGGPLN